MSPDVRRARDAVATVFILNGLTFACLVARLPDIRAGLALTNGELGLLLLAITAGSICALVLSGHLVPRFGASAVIRFGCVCAATGLAVASVGVVAWSAAWVVAAGFAVYGVGIGSWDVAMNVEAAEVERELGRTIMPRFHAGWSVGTFAGAGLGVVLTRYDVPLLIHVAGVAALCSVVAGAASARFVAVHEEAPVPASGRNRSPWLEPRTLGIGLMVMCFAIGEGAANDWLAIALIDGHDAAHWAGVAGFTLFVLAMTIGRVWGGLLLDHFGRVPVLGAAAVVCAGGIVLLVFGSTLPVVALGIVLWGLGASLGFPVGISAAADDPLGAARRVGVVSTIAYAAFLGGPPLLGALADEVGTLRALLAAAVVMGVALVTVRVARAVESA